MIQRIPIASFILDFRLSCQEFTIILPGSRPLKHPNVKAPMSGQYGRVSLREVQGICQGLVPWVVKGSVTPHFLLKQDVLCMRSQQAEKLLVRARPNNCAMGHKDIVHNWFDDRTLRIGFEV